MPNRHHHRSVALSANHRRLIYGVGTGLWLSGGAWLIFHYFLVQNGEFGPTPHPLEPWWLKAHGAFAFAALWSFGLLWGIHIVNGWAVHRRRRSGGLLVGTLTWLVLSGYLLYYLSDERLRPIVSLLHWGVGLASLGLLGAHVLLARHLASRRLLITQTAKPAMQPQSSAEAQAAGQREKVVGLRSR